MDIMRTGGRSLFIPGMMAQRMTRLNPGWAFVLMTDFVMTSPTMRLPDICTLDYDQIYVWCNIVKIDGDHQAIIYGASDTWTACYMHIRKMGKGRASFGKVTHLRVWGLRVNPWGVCFSKKSWDQFHVTINVSHCLHQLHLLYMIGRPSQFNYRYKPNWHHFLHSLLSLMRPRLEYCWPQYGLRSTGQ